MPFLPQMINLMKRRSGQKGCLLWEQINVSASSPVLLAVLHLCVFNIAITQMQFQININSTEGGIQYKRCKNSQECFSPYLLLGFRGVTLDWFSCHHGFQRLLNSADLLRLDVQRQGEERLQGGRFLRILLIHHRSDRRKQSVRCEKTGRWWSGMACRL